MGEETKWVPEVTTDDGDLWYQTGRRIEVPVSFPRGSYRKGIDDRGSGPVALKLRALEEKTMPNRTVNGFTVCHNPGRRLVHDEEGTDVLFNVYHPIYDGYYNVFNADTLREAEEWCMANDVGEMAKALE